jgi:D-alanine-D-alanine ligase
VTDVPVTVLHLIGSPVDDFHAELSRLYAYDCLTALADVGYRMLIAYVSPDGTWRFPSDADPAAFDAARPLSLPQAVDHILGLGVDVMVPQMFCRPGMTSYRALFDVMGVPYLGNPPAVMAIAADKVAARAVVAQAGVAVPVGEVVTAGRRPSLPLPVVVKPATADNSVAVTLVEDAGQLDAAVAAAAAHADSVLVESYIPLGREVRCGVLDLDGELVCLPLEEYAVDTATNPIRTAADKLARTDGGDLYLVAKESTRAWTVPVDDPVTARVWEAARICHRALGGRHYGLFDFRIDPQGRPWFLEAGPYCSFSPSSVIATMASAAGMALPELFSRVLTEAGIEVAHA